MSNLAFCAFHFIHCLARRLEGTFLELSGRCVVRQESEVVRKETNGN